jgi:hypothetical protein
VLSSPLVLLAAAAARTSVIRLGTAVIAPSLELGSAGTGRGWDLRYVEFPGAHHTQMWNPDSARVRQVVSGLLDDYR